MSNVRINTPLETTELSLMSDPGETFKNPQQLFFIRTLLDVLRRFMGAAIRRDQSTPQIILASPNGAAFAVTVSNDGEITATRVDRNSRIGNSP